MSASTPASPPPSRAIPPAISAPRSRRMAEAERTQRGARFRRPRRRPAVPRRAQHHAFRRAGHRRRAQAGHDLHHRADDQSRPAARENPLGRLDRRDPRPHALGAGRAFDRHHRDRQRDLHALARAACSTRSQPGEQADGTTGQAVRWTGWPRRRRIDLKAGHRERVRERFNKVGGEAFTDVELLEAVLHLCLPRKDTKDLAKLLLEALRLLFGGAGGAAPRSSPRSRASATTTITNLKVDPGRGAALCARQGRPRAADPQLMDAADRLLPRADGVRGHRAVPHPVSRQEEPADRRRGAADAARSTTRRSIRAR